MLKNTINKRGIALIVTLWIVVILCVIAYSLSYELRIDTKISALQRDDYLAYTLAKAGVARAILDLKNDSIFDHVKPDTAYDALGDIWGLGADDKTDIKLGKGTYTFTIVDEESKFNLNTVTLEVFKNMLLLFDVEEKDAEIIAAAIVDWRDSDDNPSVALSGNKESEVYDKYINERFHKKGKEKVSYRCKNEKFTSVEELLDVCGMTPELFYGNPDKPPKYLKSRYTKRGERKVYGMRDFFTVDSNSLININTAPFEVLYCIGNMTSSGDKSSVQTLVDKIIEYRQGRTLDDIDDDTPFLNTDEFLKVVQTDPNTVGILNAMGDVSRFTVRSYTFTITSTGSVGKTHHTIVAKVSRSMEEFARKVDSKRKEIKDNPSSTDNSNTESGVGESKVTQHLVRIFEWTER